MSILIICIQCVMITKYLKYQKLVSVNDINLARRWKYHKLEHEFNIINFCISQLINQYLDPVPAYSDLIGLCTDPIQLFSAVTFHYIRMWNMRLSMAKHDFKSTSMFFNFTYILFHNAKNILHSTQLT